MAREVAPRVIHVGAIELADAIVREAGPRADGLRARLVTQEAQRQLHARALAAVAIVRDAHARNFGKNSPKRNRENWLKIPKFILASVAPSATIGSALWVRRGGAMLLRCESEGGIAEEDATLAAGWLRAG